MKMNRNQDGIGYFVMRTELLKKRLKLKSVKCNDCSEVLDANSYSTLIPALNSIYCEHCAQVQLHNLGESYVQEDFQRVKEAEYIEKFKFD